MSDSGPCFFSVLFVPTVPGRVHEDFVIESETGAVLFRIPVRGDGVAPPPPPPPPTPAGAVVAVAPTSHNFGTLTTSTSSSYFFTVTNSGDTVATFTSATVTGDVTAVMSLSANGCAGQTLAPGGSCTVTVAVAMGASPGAQSGQLTIVTSAGTLSVPLNYTRVP